MSIFKTKEKKHKGVGITEIEVIKELADLNETFNWALKVTTDLADSAIQEIFYKIQNRINQLDAQDAEVIYKVIMETKEENFFHNNTSTLTLTQGEELCYSNLALLIQLHLAEADIVYQQYQASKKMKCNMHFYEEKFRKCIVSYLHKINKILGIKNQDLRSKYLQVLMKYNVFSTNIKE